MKQSEQCRIAEDLINDDILPVHKRIIAHCEDDCENIYGGSNCAHSGCMYYDIMSTLQKCEAFLGSNLIDARLQNGRA